ncbi:hypothetical protein AVEN_148761-1 [Araneus ventricosus]|uniref:C2H2-type domain-containing protein n=1 Tax=Araneus ventricosus TaxID=182803 RepID=A0A4Y2W0D9_ARAVE|nr:hypothetical protein AVEN_192430-1 [Araneus ventricosus]GBO29468.1 hypothetical protein AVEN_231864-1 [Araneus ventricosus]GBO29477.1 hypothetical protein AVEN_148761-1 [Araneus ventricosus]
MLLDDNANALADFGDLRSFQVDEPWTDPPEKEFEEESMLLDDNDNAVADFGDLRRSRQDEPFESQKSNELNFTCNACGRRFSKNYNLRGHLRTVHSVAAFNCPVCDKGLSRLDNLSRHLKLHQTSPERKDRI